MPVPSAAHDCPICLDALGPGSVSLGCGHVFHEACLDAALDHAGDFSLACPLCKRSVEWGRIKRASAVPGAAAGGGGYRGFAVRSAMPTRDPPRPAPPVEGVAASHQYTVQPGLIPAGWPMAEPLAGAGAGNQLLHQLQAAQAALVGGAPRAAPPGFPQAAFAPPAPTMPAPAVPAPEEVQRRNQALIRQLVAQLQAGAAGAQARAAGGMPPPPPRPPAPAPAPQAGPGAGTEGLDALQTAQFDLQMAQLAMMPLMPPPPPRMPAPAPAPAPQRVPSRAPSRARSRRSEPGAPGDSAALLRLVTDQLGAAGAAAAPPAGAAGSSTWLFCLDISGSVGSSGAWSTDRASRLCFALAALASTAGSQVATDDWISVLAYADGVATLKPWWRKPADFNPAAFLEEMAAAVRTCGLSRGGTRTYKAVIQSMQGLVTQASAAPAGATHSLVLLTDGEAFDDQQSLERARALLQDPPLAAGGFRGLLIHIDSPGGSSSLAQLAQGPDDEELASSPPFPDAL